MNHRKLLAAQGAEHAKSEKFLAVILLGVGMVCYFGSRYFRFANLNTMTVNPVESFIILGSDQRSFTCVTFFPLMLLTFDAPFFSDRSVYEIVRVGKRPWLTSKILFVVLEILMYQLMVFGFSVLLSFCSARTMVWKGWSPAMEYLTGDGWQLVASRFQLSFPYPGFTQALSPWEAVGVTSLFNGAYCLVLALVMISCNILLKDTKGWVIAAAIHILGYVIHNSGSGILFRFGFSLLNCALPAWQFSGSSHGDAIVSGITFAVLLLLLLPIRTLERRLMP